MKRPHSLLAVSLLCSAAGLTGGVRAGATDFEALGSLATGEVTAWARGISADGLVAVGRTQSGAAPVASFRWEAGVAEPIPGYAARAASADGAVVVGGPQRWDDGVLTPLSFHANDVSADGSVIVGHATGLVQRSENGVVASIPLPPGLTAPIDRPVVVSADGSVVAGNTWESATQTYRAFRWEGGVVTLLPFLDGTATARVGGISADGSTIVGASGGSAVYWKDGAVHALPRLPFAQPGTQDLAFDASADGAVIVGRSVYSVAQAFAVTWVAGQAYSIANVLTDHGFDLGDWNLSQAEGVSDDGRTIVGDSEESPGVSRAWMARLDACDNGVDDDSDGFADFPDDPGCVSAASPTEAPKCQNGIDDDTDGKVDYDGGASAHGGTPIAAMDPQCISPGKNNEKKAAGGCGLGAELVLAMVALGAWGRRILR